MNITIKHIEAKNRKDYLDYLLLADESEEIVREYIHDGDMYTILCEERVTGVVLFTFHPHQVIELKNIALLPDYRGSGIGKAVICEAFQLYKQKGQRKMIVGTANSSIANLAFYQKAGFRIAKIKKDFFLKYSSPIYEDGIRALDMVMFEKVLNDERTF